MELEYFPKGLLAKKNAPLLTGIMRGVEREALRTDSHGKMAMTPHPEGLGSALTHPQITTDFSEALLEFITPPTHTIDDLFFQLDTIHRYTLGHMPNETLWTHSMPCEIGQEDGQIPVARYGSSNNGQMKTVYRVGLGHRYGRTMQTVAGVHYNFSLPNAFWAFLSSEQNSLDDLQQFKDTGYFSLIRNFRRHYWLLIYLFGSSPALCTSFVRNKQHNLATLNENTLYLPHATSLRMGDLGYQSSAQESLYVCYNDKNSYIKSLCKAITCPHAEYERIGIKGSDGQYQQLNTSLLQIENEFYSAVRPKRSARPGETALFALQNRGVEYIEVRCLDINPFTPLGVSAEQMYFVDTFLLYCALQSSPQSSPDESCIILRNQKRVVNQGRQPGLELETFDGKTTELTHWASDLLQALQPVAEALDSANGGEHHQQALEAQLAKVTDPAKTPSAQFLEGIQKSGKGFAQYAYALAAEHTASLKANPLSDDVQQRMNHMAEESIAEQHALESANNVEFDDFLAKYFQQYNTCKSCS